MTQFTCHGPFKVHTTKLPGGKSITPVQIKSFWDENQNYTSQIGCYVFAMRAGKGITPLYVGKATKSFVQEAFASHKLAKYLPALSTYKSGTPVMFFVAYPAKKKGGTNLKHIAALEKFLIQQAVIANPFLLNINHSSAPSWGIAGVLRSQTKKPTNGAVAFKALLGF
jgi:hypothetical protein